MTKKQKIIISIVCIVVFIAGCIGGYIYYQNKQREELYNSISIKFKSNQVVEYGSQVDLQSFIQEASGEVTLPTIDTKQVGKQKLVYKAQKEDMTREFTYEIEIKDTKKPTITLSKEKDTIEVNEKINIQDYIKSVSDPVDGKLSYKKDVQDNDVQYYTYEDSVNTKKEGTYKVKITAVDSNGNKSEKTLQIKVEKKEVVQVQETPSTNETSESSVPNQNISVNKNRIICINAGHQAKGMSAKEAVGPGSSTKKAKVSSGTTGVVSKVKESQVNLDVALKLRNELQSRGYKVVMTRTSQNVSLSNQQRAQIGNEANAGAVISIHCDGSTSSSVTGAHTIAIRKDNPYCPGLYNASSSLAKNVINSYCAATGIKNKGVSYRNDLTGLNWSTVPAIYIEMGFLSNPTEDKNLTNASFQDKCAKGIADGIDKYFN